MSIIELRAILGITQKEFSVRYNIPFRTLQNWEAGVRQPPGYVITLLEDRIQRDLINRKTSSLPNYSQKKKNLPKRSDFVGAISWLKAVQEQLGEDAVFALDEALMCQGNFGGHSDEFLVWVYGSDELTRFNGIVVLGNHVTAYDVIEKNGLRYTDFSRTINDALANEAILDMQGITEAISKYYYQNNHRLDGICVSPEYQERFESLATDAIAYYDYEVM